MPSKSPILNFFEAFTNLLKFIFRNASEMPSPRDIVKAPQIFWNPDNQSITIHGIKGKVWLTTVADTNSMDGLMDYGHTVILIKDFNKEALAVGDIIVFQPTEHNALKIIHRIIKTGTDKDGKWYKTRGDNCATPDPYKLRNHHILWLCIGIIY